MVEGEKINYPPTAEQRLQALRHEIDALLDRHALLAHEERERLERVGGEFGQLYGEQKKVAVRDFEELATASERQQAAEEEGVYQLESERQDVGKSEIIADIQYCIAQEMPAILREFNDLAMRIPRVEEIIKFGNRAILLFRDADEDYRAVCSYSFIHEHSIEELDAYRKKWIHRRESFVSLYHEIEKEFGLKGKDTPLPPKLKPIPF